MVHAMERIDLDRDSFYPNDTQESSGQRSPIKIETLYLGTLLGF
jgi:hypothetical protein